MGIVNGTSIQAAIDAAQPGDTLDVRAGGYAGFRVTKPLNIIGSGAAKVSGPASTVQVLAPGVTLQGLEIGGSTGANNAVVLVTGTNAPDAKVLDCLIGPSECYGIRNFQQDRLTVRNTTIADIASGVELHRRSGGSIFENVNIRDCKRMVSDVDGGANGGDAYVFYNTAGPISVKGGTLERLRSPSQIYKPVDGGVYNIFGSTQDLTVEDQIIKDAVNLTETGKGAADPEPRRVTFKRIKFYGNGSADPYKISSGIYLRVGIDFTFDSCEFHDADWCALMVVGGPGTNFGGIVSGLRFINNKIWLVDSEAYRIDLPGSVIAQLDGNQVYLGQQARVAEVRGTYTSSLPQFRSLIGQAAPNEYWGPEVVVPPPDPCASAKAERDAALAALAVANTQRDAYRSMIDRAQAILAEENRPGTFDKKALRSIINRADAVLLEV